MIEEKCVTKGTLFQFFTTVIATLLAVTDGMAVGWSAPMIPYFLSDKSHLKITRHQAEWTESWLLIGALAGLPATMYSADKIGRKRSLLLSSFILIITWIVIAVADRIEYIYVARFACGMFLNMAYVTAPMYVAEIADKKIRGFLSSIIFMMTLIGIIIIYSVGPFVPFYVPSIIASVLVAIEIIVFWFLPETPYYLIFNKKYAEAKKSLQKFRGTADVEKEFTEITEAIEMQKLEKVKPKDVIFVKNYRRSMVIASVLNIAQLFSSIEVIIMNLHEILERAGSIYMDSSIAAIIFSAIMLIGSLLVSVTVDKFGRKRLLIISSTLTGICLLMLAVYFNCKLSGYDTKSVSWIPIVTVMVYAMVYKYGLGIVPIVITAEIFASKIKAVGMTIADGVYVLASFIALQIFHALKDSYGVHIPFYIFACCAFLTVLFVIFFVPETKGKSLDEIQQILKGKPSKPIAVEVPMLEKVP